MIKKLTQAGLFTILLATSSLPLAADPPVTAESAVTSEGRLWNLQDADIKSVVTQVARETGKNFILDPKVSGTISIISSQPIAAGEVYEVFLAALQVLGFAAIDQGDVIKIVPDASAKFMATPLSMPGNEDDAMVVRVIPVQYVNATGLVPVLRNLVSPQGHLAAYPGSNVIIAADRAAVINRLAEVITRIDVEDTDGVEHIVLHHAAASEVVQVVNNLNNTRRPNEQTGAPVILAADDRSNTILMSGDKKRRLQLRALIAQLDIPVDRNGNTEVIYLKYQKAEDMVPVLSNIISSYYGAAAQGSGSMQELPPLRAVTGTSAASTRPASVAATQFVSSDNNNQNSSYSNSDSSNKLGSLGESGNRQALGAVIGGFGVQAEINMNALVISAPPGLMRSLKAVIAKLDVRRAQVLVEAIIVELVGDTTDELGVEWRGSGDLYGGFGAGGNTSIDAIQQTINNGNMANLPAGLNVGFIRDGSLRLLLHALRSNTNNNILATPSVVALDNSKASIFVGQNVPITTGSTLGADNTTPYTTTSFKDIGLSLQIVPQITQDKAVQLAVVQIVDNIERFDENQQPITNNRTVNTSVLVNDGDILVLGGLMRNDTQDGVEKVPGLGDLPGIGLFFSNSNKASRKTNLMIFLRPTIIREPSQGIAVSGAKYNFIRDNLLAQQGSDTGLPALPGKGRKKVVLPFPFVDQG